MTIPVARERISVAPTGAASNIGLCPHMKNPRLCRGIFILLDLPTTDVEVFATAIFRCEILRIVSPFVDSYFFLVCGVALLLKTVQYFCCDIQDYGKSPSKTSAIAISKSSYRLHLKCVTTAARSSAFIFAST